VTNINVCQNAFQESTTSVCAVVQSVLGVTFQGLSGNLNFGETPIVCGGAGISGCWNFKGGNWQQTTFNMNWANVFFAMSKSPFKNASQSLFITGGYGGPDKAQVVIKL
jgi:hypothetical protein